MNKMLLTMVAASTLVVSSLYAETGTVKSLAVNEDGSVQVVIEAATGLKYANLVGDLEQIKKGYALALTAKTTGAIVTTKFANGGWSRIQMD